MAIYLKFRNLNNLKNDIHEALVGSPAYKNSEIAIVDDDNDSDSFILAVGENNSSNLEMSLEDAVFTTEDSKEKEE